MRYLIIADMHGNWDALRSVLEDADGSGYQETLVLGDLVGYGAAPNEVVAAVRDLDCPVHAIRGNHDKVVAGIDHGLSFNPTALVAARWTTERLTPENLEFVRALPQGPVDILEQLTICHGSFLDEDEYLLSSAAAMESFEAHQSQTTFFGHTHIPSLFVQRDATVEVEVLEGDSFSLEIENGTRYMINPGSVGQPRDRDPRASYMLFDSDQGRVEIRRVEYPIERAQERIRGAHLPAILADRLAVGI